MKLFIMLFLFASFATIHAQEIDYVKISEKFIKSAKFKDDKTPYYIKVLAEADKKELKKQLYNDELKKTFFINVYNAYTIFALKKDPKKYEDRNKFFKSKQFVLAKSKISLDIIEHGFLRKSSIKLSLGKLHKLFPSRLERLYRVDKVDYRIHFALNCGAKSCPPVRFYDSKTIDMQLDQAKSSYLKNDTKYDKEKNTLSITSLMSWFRGDFGNKDGIIKIFKELKMIPENANPELKYNDYDWTLYIDNFKY